MIGIIITTAECNLDCKYCYEHCRQRTRISRIEINKCFSEQISQINEFVSFISVSANRNDRNAQIVRDMTSLSESTGMMNTSMEEMAVGARKINETGVTLNEISDQVKDAISKIGSQVDLFKV